MLPPNLTLLVDGDILRYEIGFGAETGYRAFKKDHEAIPTWSFVEEMLHQRLAYIQGQCNTNVTPEIYLTEGKNFRFDVAKTKPYKGTRKEKKPWHFNNLTVYLRDILGASVCEGIEADDAMAMRHISDPNTIICSRDKDLKQVPGWFYSWELGRQPSFGPALIDEDGYVELDRSSKPARIKGVGRAFFYAQLLCGDTVDNIPGLPGCGAVAAYAILTDKSSSKSLKERVYEAYEKTIGEGWQDYLREQGRLCWLLRAPDKHWDLHAEG